MVINLHCQELAEIRENEIYIFRDYADRFFVLSFSKRSYYLKCKIQKCMQEIQEELKIRLYIKGEFNSFAKSHHIIDDIGLILQ